MPKPVGAVGVRCVCACLAVLSSATPRPCEGGISETRNLVTLINIYLVVYSVHTFTSMVNGVAPGHDESAWVCEGLAQPCLAPWALERHTSVRVCSKRKILLPKATSRSCRAGAAEEEAGRV
ncbi:hypothetical protein E2C01_047135 [Portunus trituberculatus]|uniref:Secreted protein n=1 Tax=Portunus trituberculatus TaxID=210409 RepID=A0A5B7G6Y0_PORTR|nr:hypothetical protein [Portunus trituberculatus]